MIPAPRRAVSSAAQAWDIMRDDVTLRQSLMTPGFNEQRQKDLLGLNHEAQQRGNAGYYLPARIELEIRDTNERAQALYDACCEVWEIHGLQRTRVFYRAVFDNCLQTLFGTRRVVVTSELEQRDQVMRRPGDSSGAQGSLARRMDQLRATWSQKMEKEARDSDTRERVARERAAQLGGAEQRFTRNEYKPQASQPLKPGRKQRLPPDFVAFAGELWEQRQSATNRVSIGDLLWIAQQLDTRGTRPRRITSKRLRRVNSRTTTGRTPTQRLAQFSLGALSRCAGKRP